MRRGLWLAVALVLAMPIASLAQEAGAEELPGPDTQLEPGRYYSTAVGPRIEFRVDDGWVAGAADSGPIFTLERADEPGTVLTVTRFDGAVFVESCDATSMTEVEISVPRLVEIIGGNPFLNPATPRLIEIDGHSGFELDVAVPPIDECALPYLLLWALPMEDGEFLQFAGQQSRFIVVDVDGTVVVVAIESLPGVPFGSLLDAGMDVVDSMRFEPAPPEGATSTAEASLPPEAEASPGPTGSGDPA